MNLRKIVSLSIVIFLLVFPMMGTLYSIGTLNSINVSHINKNGRYTLFSKNDNLNVTFPSNVNVTVVKVERDILPDIYGLLIVNDTFTIFNNEESLVSYFVFYIPNNFTKYLNHISGISNLNTRLTLIRTESEYINYTKFVVLLDAPIYPFENYTFTINMVYTNLIKLQQSEQQSFLIDYYLFPIIPHNVSWMYVKVKLPLSAVKQDIYPDFNGTADTFGHNRYNVPAMKYETFNITYEFTQTPIVEYSYIVKHIRLYPTLGFIYVVENHNVKNLGKEILNNLAVYIPNRSYDIVAVDDYGKLTTYPHTVGNKIAVTTRFRLDIKPNYTYQFNISYKVPLDELVREDGLSYLLNVDANPHIPILIRNYTIDIAFPEGLSIVEYFLDIDSNAANVIYEGNSIRMLAHNITHLYFNSLIVRYLVTFIPNYLKLAFFSSLVGLISALYVLSRKTLVKYLPIERRAVVEEAIPVDLIREFTDLYDEKLGIIFELEKLEDDLAAGKIKKKQYLSKKATLENELKNVIKRLEPVKEELRKAGHRYAERVRRLEILEEERERAKASLEFLEKRYRLKKIRKSVYEKLVDEQMKKLRKATEEIDRIIFDLRQLIQ
ncbi:MAG: hypothetical protein ACP6IS_09290 [Candidatus Asgardarchaeia archaeon]